MLLALAASTAAHLVHHRTPTAALIHATHHAKIHLRGGATVAMADAQNQKPQAWAAPAPAAVPLTPAAITASHASPASYQGDLLLLPLFSDDDAKSYAPSDELRALDAAYSDAISAALADDEFTAKPGTSSIATLPIGSATKRVAVVGLGKATDFGTSPAASYGAAVARIAKEVRARSAAVVVPSAASAAQQQTTYVASLVGLSPDVRYKTSDDPSELKLPKLEKLELLGGDAAALTRAVGLAQGVLLTRGLVASPPNYLTPTAMAAAAAEVAAASEHLTLEVLERAECEARGMGAYLGVSQGASEPPKFIHLTYTPPGGAASKKVAFVGKGLTFDSGGYNLKVGAGSIIEKMKFDMGGAGAVLGAARAIGALAPPGVEVHFIVASCENMVGENAMRPGDILTASNSKTIEVLNTDAEGRLTLADALVFAEGLGKMEAIVDVATLTGACIVALGPSYAGLWAADDKLADGLLGAAKESGELLWRMPLADEYKEQIKSPIADLQNLGAPGGGGSITAALFLKEFVKEAPWAHLDIAGPVWNDKEGGATGYGVRTLVQFAESHSSG